jgi:hypothetical protein
MEIRLFQREDTDPLTDLLHDMSRHTTVKTYRPATLFLGTSCTISSGPESDIRIVVANADDRIIGIAMVSVLYPASKERAQLFMKEFT